MVVVIIFWHVADNIYFQYISTCRWRKGTYSQHCLMFPLSSILHSYSLKRKRCIDRGIKTHGPEPHAVIVSSPVISQLTIQCWLRAPATEPGEMIRCGAGFSQHHRNLYTKATLYRHCTHYFFFLLVRSSGQYNSHYLVPLVLLQIPFYLHFNKGLRENMTQCQSSNI